MTAIAILCTLIMAVGVVAFSMLFMLLMFRIFERRDVMTQFRVNKKLEKKGVNAKRQGLIYYTCMNYNDQPEQMQDTIKNLCAEIARMDAPALFRFVTDAYVNDKYICINYNVPQNKLFKWKHEFYMRMDKIV